MIRTKYIDSFTNKQSDFYGTNIANYMNALMDYVILGIYGNVITGQLH